MGMMSGTDTAPAVMATAVCPSINQSRVVSVTSFTVEIQHCLEASKYIHSTIYKYIYIYNIYIIIIYIISNL